MGYYSYHVLNILTLLGDFISDEQEQDINNYLETHPFGDYEFDNLNQISCESLKWYSADEDIQKLSMSFPTFLFELFREGEESMDFERQIFHNGELMIREIGELTWVDTVL